MLEKRSILLVYSLVALALFTALPVYGSTITVTNTNDSGPGSLRAAIAGANSGDTITFAPTVTGTIALTSGKLTIGKSLAINGPGASQLAISGNLAATDFEIDSGTVSISGLTIENGFVGILNKATLTVTSSAVSNNFAGNKGGGIENEGTLTLTNSTISSNTAVLYGGGISNLGTLAVTNSTIWNNSALIGGGISNSGTGTLTVAFSTISRNAASLGGGINNGATSTVTLKNSIVASNDGGNCGLAAGGVATDDGYNLTDDSPTNSCTFLTSPSDQLVSLGSAKLGPLSNNGGPTLTAALLARSPAIDAIPLADCTDVSGKKITTDQRGGFHRPDNAEVFCDIGAFEHQDPVPFSSFSAMLGIGATSFDLNSTFTLGAGTGGINPLTEGVTLQVGTYQVTVPATSLQKSGKGSYVFQGVIDGVSLQIQIVPLGGNSYQFKAMGSPVNLTGLANPVTVTLTFGNDTGTISVNANL